MEGKAAERNICLKLVFLGASCGYHENHVKPQVRIRVPVGDLVAKYPVAKGV